MSQRDLIRQYRLRQSLRELQRKMEKVCDNRANVWTQEGLDYADAVAAKLHKRLRPTSINAGDSVLVRHAR
jgi:hypothetical protein